jgi:hypothetical protein
MAVYGMQITKSFKSDVDLSASGRYTLVTNSSAAGYITKAGSVVNSSALGVLQNNPKAGEEALVCLFGLTKIWIECTPSDASPVLVGGYLKAASSGKCSGTVPLASASMNIMGVALEAVASGSGQYIEMFFNPQLMLPNV